MIDMKMSLTERAARRRLRERAEAIREETKTSELHQNRKCPYGGGRKDCDCNGNCSYMQPLRGV